MKELILYYTNLCNSRCSTCNIWKQESPDTLTVEAVEKILKFFKKLEIIYLTGGEPFLTDICIEYAKLIKKYHPEAIIAGATNSILPDEYLKRIMAIRNLGLTIIPSVSLNGTGDVHDKSRGVKGNFEKAIKLMDGLLSNGIMFDIALLEMPETDTENVYKLAQKYGVGVGITKYRSGDRYFTENKITDIYKDFNCPAGTEMIVINPNGDITACEENRKELLIGNIYKEDIENMKWDTVISHIKDRKCQPCSMKCFYDKRT